MLQDGSLPQGSSQQCWEQERLAFSFHLLLPLDVDSSKRKGLNFQARKQSKGIFRDQDTKVKRTPVTPNLKSSTITERTPVTFEPEVLRHNREDAVTFEPDVLQATQT